VKVLINFADHNFRTSQKLNSQTGFEVGGFDRVISYSPKDIDLSFFRKNIKILLNERGAGYWLWKPYIICKALKDVKEDDYVFYDDSGSFFVHSIEPIIDVANRYELDVIVFENRRLEKKWTKRDAFILMNSDEPQYTDSWQRQSGFTLWKKSHFSLEFAEQYLYYCQDERIVSDSPNTLGVPNYPEFVENRHDQSVLSLLAKKYNVPPFRFIDQRGNKWFHLYQNSPYPQIMQLTRRRDG